MTQPTLWTSSVMRPVGSRVWKPGMESSLSSVPPVMPRPRPEIIGTRKPRQASSGARGRDTLSPMPPVECLSTSGRGSGGKFQHLTGVAHGKRQRPDLRRLQAAEVNRHQEGGHLVVRHAPVGEARNDLADLGCLERLAVAFGLDEAEKVHALKLAKAHRKATPNSALCAAGSAPLGAHTAGQRERTSHNGQQQ